MSPTNQWSASKRHLVSVCRRAAMDTLEQAVSEAQQLALDHCPVYHPGPVGEILPPPQREPTPHNWFGDDLLWIRTIAATLTHQFNLPIAEPEPRRLITALSDAIKPINAGDLVLCGFASRTHLDQATAYTARLLLRAVIVEPEWRGHYGQGKQTRPRKPQYLWYNWDVPGWQSASLVGYSTGVATAVTPGYGIPAAGWRGNLPPGAGYWADQEFGTEARQIDPAMIPAEGESLVGIYLQKGLNGVYSIVGIDAGKQRNDGQFGIPARLFLTRAAALLALRLRSGYWAGKWLKLVVVNL